MTAPKPLIHAFFDEATFTVSYLVADPVTREATVIDPVLDYDQNAGEVDTRSVETILEKAEEEGYRITWTLETHAHADHLSGSPYIKAKTGARIGIGEHIGAVQRIFRRSSTRLISRPMAVISTISSQMGDLRDRRTRGAHPAYAGPYAGRYHLSDRGRGLCR